MLDAQEEGWLALGALATADMPDLLRLSRTGLGKHDDARLSQEIRPTCRCLSREKPHHLRLVTLLIGDGEIAKGTIQLNEIVKVSRHGTDIVVTALVRTWVPPKARAERLYLGQSKWIGAGSASIVPFSLSDTAGRGAN